MQLPFNSRIILDALEQSIFIKDVNHLFLFVNKSCADLIGAKESEIVAKSDFDFFPKEIAQKYRDDDIFILESKLICQPYIILRIQHSKQPFL